MRTAATARRNLPLRPIRPHFIALALACAFAFGIPGAALAAEGGLLHKVLMRGQVLEQQNKVLVVCIGQNDGAQLGQVLDVIRHTRRSGPARQGPRYRRVAVGQVRITGLFDQHYAQAEVLSGTPRVHDTVELMRP